MITGGVVLFFLYLFKLKALLMVLTKSVNKRYESVQ